MNNWGKARGLVKNGGVIVFPTDTVWGIGCLFDNEQAVERIFTIKKRPKDLPLQVLIADKQQLDLLVDQLPDHIRQMMEKFWPGALTIIMDAKDGLDLPLVIVDRSIGIRLPNHQDLRNFINDLGKPLAATSANFHGEIAPVAKADLSTDFIRQVDLVLDGKTGFGVESTVVDARTRQLKIIRQGAVHLGESVKG
ncbi:threonylcarbamoyl-AMP synthase [Candidatus Daviesbacteria bacterium]|nr:threonylcarbamoyl-AMP synthase [Candidatus Daviesbacteria bacterium]